MMNLSTIYDLLFTKLRHSQLRPVIDAFELDFIHQRLDEFQSLSPTALAISIRAAVLTCKIGRHDAATRNSNDQFIIFHAKSLINFSIRAQAVLGGVDARLDQRQLDLIDCLRREVDAPRDLF